MRTSEDNEGSAPGEPTRAEPDGEPVQVADGSVESAGDRIVGARPGAPTDAPLARARVMGALFDDSVAAKVGRFRVLGRLGAGGMGVVYEAYDPDLSRGVALKLVNVAAKDRETALAEAKALARLSHPNVVPIYDVGLERDRVYLVMELVRGKTLRDWVVRRTPREILEVYQQAGRALAAAHAAGLVHRDFKPENAVVGADGRVRVVDFGLACEADAPERAAGERRAVAGTPRFMAPEIKAGAAVTPAADQYSFCVALAEALAGSAEPAPRRIAMVLERGRAAEPGQRFPAMVEVLRALARDPARTRRRAAAIGGLAVSVGAIAFMLGRHAPSDAGGCDDGAARLEAVWSRAARAGALDRIAGFGEYGRSQRGTLERTLDANARSWVREFRAACLDHQRGAQSSALSDRRTACLDAERYALAEVRVLVTGADAGNLSQLTRAVQSMPDPAACSDLAALASEVSPPPPGLAPLLPRVSELVTQASIQLGAGRNHEALAIARGAVALARGVGYAPALADALLVAGHAQQGLVPKDSVAILTEAMTVANLAHRGTVAIEAWARRAYALAVMTPDVAVAEADFVESVARASAPHSVALALLYNNLGNVALARERRAEARDYFARALAESHDFTGPGALELVVARANLGMTTEDRAAGDRLIAEAAARLARDLGREHPDTLDVQLVRATTTLEDLAATEQLLVPTCLGYEVHKGYRAEDCWSEVGQLRADRGDRAGALDAMKRAARTSPDALLEAAYATLWRGDARAAAARFSDAIKASTPSAGGGTAAAAPEPWWGRLTRAELRLGLGRARRELGDLRGAREALEPAVAELASIAREHPASSFERRLGRAQVELAFTLGALGAGYEQRGPLAAAALAWLRRVGGAPAELAALVTATAGSTR